MRSKVSALFAAAAVAGSLFVAAPAATAAENDETGADRAASCVQLVRFWEKGFNRMVEVKNTCSQTACFTVTVAARKDPKFSIGGNRQESFSYGGKLWSRGSGIKNVGC
ncbi:hypothetical protein [Streptomyces sp. NPDC051211]|uniref:hypothetical protein n=1 Tax=Streptomyces sp. NPDC051211 TaxID=3154643 RepID=UPI00344C4E8A